MRVSQLTWRSEVGATLPFPIDDAVKLYFLFSKIATNVVSLLTVTFRGLLLEIGEPLARSQCLNWKQESVTKA